MNAEQLFNQKIILDLSFFNFDNAITAAYFANQDLEIRRVNENFRAFFPELGSVIDLPMPEVLERMGLPAKQVEQYKTGLAKDGSVLLPHVQVTIDGQDKVFSLLLTYTQNRDFSYLNGVQDQFVDRTAEWVLRREREDLLEQKILDREIIEQKSQQL
jgi:adenylate cyclase